jgi:TetR/AcrR family transcriptional regulator
MGIHERKEREREHRREEILDAARDVFFRKGLLLTTMDEIAEKAELSKATLYLYYKSKEDLFLAVAMQGLEMLEEMFHQVLAKALSPVPTLLQFIDALDRFFEVHRNYFRLFTFFQTPQFHSAVSSDMRESCLATNHRIWTMATDVLRRGMREGVVREDINPTDVAIISMSNTTALMFRIDTELEKWKETMGVDLHRTLRLSNRLLLEAVLTDEGRRQLAQEEALAISQRSAQ